MVKLPLYHALMFASGVAKVFIYALNGRHPGLDGAEDFLGNPAKPVSI